MSTPNPGPTPNENRISSISYNSKSVPRPNYLSFRKDGKYLKQLPFWRRYQRSLTIAGSILTFCIFYSHPIYNFFRTPGTVKYEDTLWPGEKAAGKTYVVQLRERIERIKKREEEMKAAMEAEKLSRK